MGDEEQYPQAFLRAVARLLRDEGGYVNNPNDAGGETKFGISKRDYPTLDIAHLSAEQATHIYWRDFWTRYHYDALPEEIAAKLFDAAVDIGPGPAALCLQRALRANHAWWREEYPNVGPMTVEAARQAYARDPTALMAALRSELAAHYRIVAERDRRDPEFIKGWLNRAYE